MPTNMVDPNNNCGREEAEAFEAALEPFIEEITCEKVLKEDQIDYKVSKVLKDAFIWLREAIRYNLPHGKRNRGLAVVMTHRLLSQHYDKKPDLKKARIVGWCIELLQTHFLILDDIMDESLTRRKQKCWHLKQNVGKIAINDSFYMQQTIPFMLQEYFKQSPYYNDLMSLINETMLKTTIGQCLDLTCSAKPGQLPDLNNFTLDTYLTIVDYKTAFYSFSAPVRLGMLLSGLDNCQVHKKADVILRRMGQFFQVQDDYLDCFGDPSHMGKIGRDIEEGKCCWPIITALSIANPEQRAILEQNYARKDSANADAVKEVYRELNLKSLYNEYERESITELQALINEFTQETKLPGEIFEFLLRKIRGRDK